MAHMHILKIHLFNYPSNTFQLLLMVLSNNNSNTSDIWIFLLNSFVIRYKMSPVTIDSPSYLPTGGLIDQQYVIFMHIYLQLLITNVACLEK